MKLDKAFENFDKYDDTEIRNNEEYIKYIKLIFNYSTDIFTDILNIDDIKKLDVNMLNEMQAFVEDLYSINTMSEKSNKLYKIYLDLEKANVLYEMLNMTKTNPSIVNDFSSYLLF